MKLLIDGKYQKVSILSLMKCNLIVELLLSGMLITGVLLAKVVVLLIK